MLHEIVGYPLALGPAQIDIEDPVAEYSKVTEMCQSWRAVMMSFLIEQFGEELEGKCNK